jgi:preprotein translocase subunit YajC
MNFQTIIFLGGEGSDAGALGQFLPLILIIVVFYFFMIRPQIKKAKEQKNFREALQKGDKVVTIGGIHGKILDIDETTVILEMIDKARIKVEKSAISADGQSQLDKQK